MGTGDGGTPTKAAKVPPQLLRCLLDYSACHGSGFYLAATAVASLGCVLAPLSMLWGLGGGKVGLSC